MNQGIKIPYDFENMVMISRKDDSHVEGLQEQGKKPEQNIGSVTEAISREEIKQADCFVDLQLGRLGDFGNGFHQKDPRDMRVSAMGSPGKPRRSRVANGSNHVVSCLAEGCNSDFSSCKDYHKKHKVCDVHSKAPKVMVDGWEKRFCQQCSRFHLLAEFDQGKRSCRKRLDGHNKRRRKQKPEFMSVNSRNLFGNFEVTGFSPYINAHVFPSAVQDPNWTVAVKAEEDRSRGHQPPFPLMGVAPRGYNGGKSFPFLNTDDTSGSNSQVSPDASTRALNSDCALYLLSSPAQPSGNLGHIAHADTISMVQPLVQGMEDEQVGSVLASESGTTQALPFSWH